MRRQSLSERLDGVLSTILSGGQLQPAPEDPELTALGRIASALQGLPSEEFRARLANRLAAPAAPATTPEKRTGAREGFHTVNLYLAVERAEDLLDFVKGVFGATETLRTKGSLGGLHAEVRIGDSMVMIGGKEGIGQTPSAIHLYVEDTDAVYRRALEAGATSLHEPMEQPYGERSAGVADGFGNFWYIATYRGRHHVPEGLQAVNPYLHVHGTGGLIDFLEKGMGGQVLDRAQSAQGVIQHAKVRIGDSVVEMGEARGPYQPIPTAIYLYVPDVDGLYRDAVAAGATSEQEPTSMPYGDRVAFVKDPFGTTWYIATHLGRAAR